MYTMVQAGLLRLQNEPSPQQKQGGDTSTFHKVHFPCPFPEGSEVVVVPMVQTFNGAQTPGIRIDDVTVTGFKYRMNELVGTTPDLADGKHIAEDIGWIAVAYNPQC